MDRPDKVEKDDTQKVKLIFLSLAALATILLIWSLYSANKARIERDSAKQDLEMSKQDNAKLEQMVKDQGQEIDALKKQVQQCEAKAKAKPAAKPTVKKKAPAKSKKPTKSVKHK
jgi:septal ring factor EnvC (AmiA/AmiB activator)